MKNPYLLGQLQEKHKKGGFALVSEKEGKEFAFGHDIKVLYDRIREKGIKDSNKDVMYIPPLNSVNVF